MIWFRCIIESFLEQVYYEKIQYQLKSIPSWSEKGHEPSLAELKILQLELWLESARLGLITKSFMYSYSFRNIFVIRKSCIKFLSSLWMPSNLALKWREVIFRNGFKVKRGVKGKKEKEIAIATRSILSIVKKRSQFVDFNSEGAFIFLFYFIFTRYFLKKKRSCSINC